MANVTSSLTSLTRDYSLLTSLDVSYAASIFSKITTTFSAADEQGPLQVGKLLDMVHMAEFNRFVVIAASYESKCRL